jgi:hypothetical protein
MVPSSPLDSWISLSPNSTSSWIVRQTESTSLDIPSSITSRRRSYLVQGWSGGGRAAPPLTWPRSVDIPAIAGDKNQVNNFSFLPAVDSQIRCPFHAHVRKTMPRADLASLNRVVLPPPTLPSLTHSESCVPVSPTVLRSQMRSGRATRRNSSAVWPLSATRVNFVNGFQFHSAQCVFL